VAAHKRSEYGPMLPLGCGLNLSQNQVLNGYHVSQTMTQIVCDDAIKHNTAVKFDSITNSNISIGVRARGWEGEGGYNSSELVSRAKPSFFLDKC